MSTLTVQSLIASIKSHIVWVIAGLLLAGGIGSYAAIKAMEPSQESEYGYQDPSGSNVILGSGKCGFEASQVKKIVEAFNLNDSTKVKALSITGQQGWVKQGCWALLNTTKEVVVFTDSDTPDAVLELSQFKEQPSVQSKEQASPSKFSTLFSSIDPSKQVTFQAQEIPGMDKGTVRSLTTLDPSLSCQAVSPRIASTSPQVLGVAMNSLRAAKMEGQIKEGSTWVSNAELPACWRNYPEKKQVLVILVDRQLQYTYDWIDYSYLTTKIN